MILEVFLKLSDEQDYLVNFQNNSDKNELTLVLIKENTKYFKHTHSNI